MERGGRGIGFRCDICHRSADQGAIVTCCGHRYCQACSYTWLRPMHVCPVCQAPLHPRTGLLPIRPSGLSVAAISAPNFLVWLMCDLCIWFAEGVLLEIVERTAYWLHEVLDRSFSNWIYVEEERDNVDDEESENDNVDGEGGENENGSNVAAEVMDSGNNGDGSSSPAVVHPIGGVIQLPVRGNNVRVQDLSSTSSS